MLKHPSGAIPDLIPYTFSSTVGSGLVFPGTTVDKSPRGNENGKSTDWRIWLRKMYQPRSETTRRIPAPACWYVRALSAWPFATAKNEAVKQETVGSKELVVLGSNAVMENLQQGTRITRIVNKMMFVRILAMAKMAQRMAMEIRKNAKVE